ncbi:uncharacterized protein VTP21DRAFT_11620 [Calcarisporiella thermophila]|uniref:uncharacterized protein n=1 Tax=Calcarisporiella thermophila TaxID=911321 RepID=UPI00374423A9
MRSIKLFLITLSCMVLSGSLVAAENFDAKINAQKAYTDALVKEAQDQKLPDFKFEETSIAELQAALNAGTITSRQLVAWYVKRINEFDNTYRGVQELNPDLFQIADALDNERKENKTRGPMHGIPILLKDNIATGDKMYNTAGSLSLWDDNCKPTRDSTLAQKLREAGAIIFGKACMSEWANFRTLNGTLARYHDSDGFSGRCGQTANAYNTSTSPSGSSGGSAVSVAANFITVALGSDTDASIVAPASIHALVGLRPTVGLTSRDLVIPISHTQDTVGPLARSVADAAAVLEVIAGLDSKDTLTNMPPPPPSLQREKYTAALDKDGLKGMRIGVPQREFWFAILNNQADKDAMENAIKKIAELGATVVDPAPIPTSQEIVSKGFKAGSPEYDVLLTDYKHDINAYLATLPKECPMKTMQDLIDFNNRNADKEMQFFGQDVFLAAQNTTGLDDPKYKEQLALDRKLGGEQGIDAAMNKDNLDLLVVPVNWAFFPPQPMAMAGYPMITVPIGFDANGVPFALGFIGRAYSESQLIKAAYAFEQATKARKPPVLHN